MTLKHRITWIDVMKGYGMLFVMLHHLSFVPGIYRTFYAPFFLTEFFVSAGITFNVKRDFKAFVVNKLKTLVLPLFILDTLNTLISLVLNQGETNVLSELKGLCVQIGTTHLWFIAAMFVFCVAFYPVAKYCGDNKKKLIIAISALAIINTIFSVATKGLRLPWHVNFIGIGCFWLGIGYLLKGKPERLNDLQTKKKVVLILCVVLVYVLVLVLSCCSGHSYLGFEQVDDNPLLYLITNGVGVVLILILSVVTPQFKLIRFIGRNTLFYFAFHGKIQALLLMGVNKIGVMPFVERHYYVTPIVFVMVESLILYAPCIIFSKLVPFAVGKGWYKKAGK